MNTQEIKLFVENIKNKSNHNGFIGFYYDDEDHEGYNSYIKANRDGLVLYAAEILQASLEIDNKKSTNDKLFKISNDLVLKYSDFQISHIEFCDMTKSELNKPNEEYQQTWKDKLSGYVFFIIIILILISIFVGAITIIGWLF